MVAERLRRDDVRMRESVEVYTWGFAYLGMGILSAATSLAPRKITACGSFPGRKLEPFVHPDMPDQGGKAGPFVHPDMPDQGGKAGPFVHSDLLRSRHNLPTLP